MTGPFVLLEAVGEGGTYQEGVNLSRVVDVRAALSRQPGGGPGVPIAGHSIVVRDGSDIQLVVRGTPELIVAFFNQAVADQQAMVSQRVMAGVIARSGEASGAPAPANADNVRHLHPQE